jgi:redox-sensitive bicupin YhaK (pirin superfamily)
VTAGWSLGLVAMRGDAAVQGAPLREGQLAVFQRSGSDVVLQATTDATVLILAGEPIGEPVVGQGPFVMNSTREIQQAFEDFHAGRMG